MATTAQVQAFVAQWQGAANTASQQLDIPASYILAQWGMESAYGTEQVGGGQNNPGNVGNLGGGNFVNYASQSDFVNAYVKSMMADFPYFKNPIPNPTIANIFGGKQSYDPSNGNYNVNVTGAYNVLKSEAGSAIGALGSGAGSASTSTSSASISTGPSLLSWITDPIGAVVGATIGPLIAAIMWAVLALVLFCMGIMLLTKDTPVDAAPTINNAVTPAANSVGNAAKSIVKAPLKLGKKGAEAATV